MAQEQGLSLTGPDGLLKQLTKTVLETSLGEELTEHLGYEKHDPAGAGSGARADGMFRLPVRRMRTAANAHDGIRILSGWTLLYPRPPTF